MERGKRTKRRVDWKEIEEGQSRVTYTGAAQSLRGAKVERGGRREEEKIEEEERQHTVKPGEDITRRRELRQFL